MKMLNIFNCVDIREKKIDNIKLKNSRIPCPLNIANYYDLTSFSSQNREIRKRVDTRGKKRENKMKRMKELIKKKVESSK